MTRPQPRLVFAHGFTQTARSWDTLRAPLTDALPDADLVAVDLPGHGEAADVRADLRGAADHLASVGGHGIYVGYSMGGRVALHTALRHGDLVDGLVLIGATAGIDDEDERAARRTSDEELADSIMASGVDAFLDRWLANPLFDGLDDSNDQRADRLRNTSAGLASSLRLCGTGTQRPLWDRLDEITCPVLVLVGERDEKFRRLGVRLTEGLPDAALEVVSNAGHSVHLEQPATTARAIARWVRAIDPPPT